MQPTYQSDPSRAGGKASITPLAPPGRGKQALHNSLSQTLGVPLPGMEQEALSLHPKLGRELYRGQLQEDLAGKLAGDECGQRRVGLVGNSLVDTETGEVLDASQGEHPELYISAMHTLAADPRFRWVGFRQGSDNRGEGNAVPLGGSSWEVSDRADPSYQARLKTRARREIAKSLDRGWSRLYGAKILASRRYKERFVTLTAPTRDYTSRLEEWSFHNLALGRLRETEFVKERVWGGVKNLEDPGADRPHVHSHSIWIARYVPQVALAWEWTRCALDTFEEQDGHRPADPRQEWLERGWSLDLVMKAEDQVSEAKKRIKKARTKQDREDWEYKLQEAGFWLDAIRKVCFVVDVRLVGKSTTPGTIERQEAILEVCKYVTKTTDLLQRLQADLLGLLLPPRAPRVFDTFGACRGTRKQENAILEALREAAEGAENRAPASLDTTAIISGADCAKDGQEGVEGEEKTPQTASNPPPKKERPPSWRVLMGVLPLSEFIRVMRLRAVSSSAFAMRRLQERGIWAWTVAEVLEMGECPDPFSS
jgi:hypothetical protein